MGIGNERCHHHTGCHWGALSREDCLVGRLRIHPFIARPAEVLATSSAEFFPAVPPHVSKIGLSGDWMERETKGISESIGVDFRLDRIGAIVERIIARGGAVLIDAQDFSAQIVEVLRDKGVDIGITLIGVISVPHKEFAVRTEPQGPVQMGMKVIGNRQENCFASGQRHIRILRISGKSGEPGAFRARVVGIAAIFTDVADIHVSVHQEVWVQCQAQHATVVKQVDVIADVQERGSEQLAVLINSNHAVALPDEHAPVTGPRDTDRQERREGRDDFRCECRVTEGFRLCRRRE